MNVSKLLCDVPGCGKEVPVKAKENGIAIRRPANIDIDIDLCPDNLAQVKHLLGDIKYE
jgi:hypothetical protein